MGYHTPVMLKESVDALDIHDGGCYLDLTFGGGGHSREILKRMGTGSLIAFDQDPDAVNNTINDERFLLLKHNFRYMKHFLAYLRAIPVDGILADLGISSYQIDEAKRGFSTRFEGKLDMRMNPQQSESALSFIGQAAEEDLIKILRNYGELANARSIASDIVKARAEKSIDTTTALIEVLSWRAPKGRENKYYARIFQAIRIYVNDELKALEEMLQQSPAVLKKGGRLVVISYHSLEDRLVKNFFKSGNFEGKIEKDFYGNPLRPFEIVNKKPIPATEQEIKSNPRARSAKLRICEKL